MAPETRRIALGAGALVAVVLAVSGLAWCLDHMRRPAPTRRKVAVQRPCCSAARGVVTACIPMCGAVAPSSNARCPLAVTAQVKHPASGALTDVRLSWDERELGGDCYEAAARRYEVCYDHYDDSFEADNRAGGIYAARRCEPRDRV
jgi:hypothetical protein